MAGTKWTSEGYLGIDGDDRHVFSQNDVNALNRLIDDEFTVRAQAEQDLFELQAKYAKELFDKRKAIAQQVLQAEKKAADDRQKYIEKQEKKLAKKHNGKLTEEEKKLIREKAEQKFKIEQDAYNKLLKKATKAEAKKEALEYTSQQGDNLRKNRLGGLASAFTAKGGGFGFVQGIASLASAFKESLKGFEESIDEIAKIKSSVDTRLYGSGKKWDKLNSSITNKIGMSGLVKQQDIANNLKEMVGKGIAFNVEQRALLQTLSGKIATTFEATDATLTKLVRIQQQDSTAARLGMEAALNAFLNNMYETTEYMTDAAKEIRSQVYEASALTGAATAAGFEYQVQKWLGSLYSVGFSNTSGIASALGKLASGQLEGISEGGLGNLMVMAATRANLSIADLLGKGLDESDTNSLMKAMVDYLGGIYQETKGNNVLAQQYAKVFGLTASDLKAAANLNGSTGTIADNNLSYGGMISNLQNMANSMYSRTSIGEQMSNIFANFKYGTAAGVASSPALYSIFKIASLLRETTGGIHLPMVMGTGLDATIADLMQEGVLATSIIGGLGSMLGGLGRNGSDILSKFGITGKASYVTRGSGTGYGAVGISGASESGYIGNADSGDVKSKTMQGANEQVAEAQSEDSSVTMSDVNESILAIYQLLKNVTTGTDTLHVSLDENLAWNK